MDTVYIETSIVSHATALPSSDIQVAALQHQARRRWSVQRPKFSIVTSQLVIDEASAGDPSAAAERLKLLDGVPTLPINNEARTLAREIVAASIMPPKAAADALHDIRERLLAEAGGTLDALVDRLQAEERESDRPQFKPKQCVRRPDARPSVDITAENQLPPSADH